MLPSARVVKEGRRLRVPPRAVPLKLWLVMTFGRSYILMVVWTLSGIFAPFAFIWTSMTSFDRSSTFWTANTSVLLFSFVWFWFIRTGLRELHVLRTGIETQGKLVGKTTRGRDKYQRWLYTFEYMTETGPKQTTLILLGPTPELEDQATETLVYDPSGRLEATTLDHLPGSPEITDAGALRARGGTAVLVVTILGHVILIASIASMWMRR